MAEWARRAARGVLSSTAVFNPVFLKWLITHCSNSAAEDADAGRTGSNTTARTATMVRASSLLIPETVNAGDGDPVTGGAGGVGGHTGRVPDREVSGRLATRLATSGR